MPIQLDSIEQLKSTLIDLGIRFGPKVVIAILILVAGVYAAHWAGAAFGRWPITIRRSTRSISRRTGGSS